MKRRSFIRLLSSFPPKELRRTSEDGRFTARSPAAEQLFLLGTLEVVVEGCCELVPFVGALAGEVGEHVFAVAWQFGDERVEGTGAACVQVQPAQ